MDNSGNHFLYSFISEAKAIEVARHHTNQLATFFSFGLLFETFALYKCPLTVFPIGIGGIILAILATIICLKCFFNELMAINCKTLKTKYLLMTVSFLLTATGCGLLSIELSGVNINPYVNALSYGLWILGMAILTFLYLGENSKKKFLLFIQTIGATFLFVGALQKNNLFTLLPTSGITVRILNWSICVFSAFAGIAAFAIIYLDDKFLKEMVLRRKFEYVAFGFPKLLPGSKSPSQRNPTNDDNLKSNLLEDNINLSTRSPNYNTTHYQR